MNTLLNNAKQMASKLYKGSRQPRWAMASQIATSGANFATTVIIVRSLGLAEFGRFSVGFLLMMIVRNFLDGTVLTPMSTIAPKLSPISLTSYRGFLAANGLVFAVVSSLILLLASIPLGELLNAPWLPSLALIIAFANFTANCADFLRRYFFVYEASACAFLVDAFRYFIQLGMLLVMAIVLPDYFTVQSAFFALIAGALAGSLFGLIFYGRVKWKKRLANAVWPRHWNFIKWMMPNVALAAVQSNGVFLIGGALLGDAALGGIRAMLSLANVTNLPVNALHQIAPTMASRSYVRGGIGAMKKFLIKITAWSLFAVFVIVLAVVIFSELLIVGIFKVSLDENLTILMLFSLLNALVALRFPLILNFQTIELPKITVFANLLGIMTSLSLIFPIISLLGPVGIPVIIIAVALVTTFVYLAAITKTTRGI